MNKWYSILLSAIAGGVNATAVYVFAVKVSHITGTFTQLIVEGQRANWSELLFLIGMLGAFFVGGIVSGCVFFDRPKNLTKRHAYMLGILGIMALLVACLPANKNSSLYLLSSMMGIQNSIYFVYNGAVLRTTHFTGYITDVAFVIGQWIKGVPVDKEKAYVFCFSMLFYILGGMIAVVSVAVSVNPLWLIMLGYGISAICAMKHIP